jgi:primosomal protein N' (replication factor Y)
MAFLHAARQTLAGEDAVSVDGPFPAPMPRRAGLHRAQLLLSSASRKAVQTRLGLAMPALHALPEARRTRWSLDVDPVDLY